MADSASDEEAILPVDDGVVARLLAAGAPADLPEKFRAAWLTVFEVKAPEIEHAEYTTDSGEKREGISSMIARRQDGPEHVRLLYQARVQGWQPLCALPRWWLMQRRGAPHV